MNSPEYRVALLEAATLTAADRATCIGIIQLGKAVDVESVRRELPKATAIAVARFENQIRMLTPRYFYYLAASNAGVSRSTLLVCIL
jgi:hypothetical protein